MANHNLSTNLASSVVIGRLAEQNACQFLEKHGLHCLEKNFITHDINGKINGEIDLIMRDKAYYVFVEVKQRHNLERGHPLEMITKPKQARIVRTATRFLVMNNLYDSVLCRFDAVSIAPSINHPNTPEIVWLKNAFEVEY